MIGRRSPALPWPSRSIVPVVIGRPRAHDRQQWRGGWVRSRRRAASLPRSSACHVQMATGRASPPLQDARAAATRAPVRGRGGTVRRDRLRVAACGSRVTAIDVRVRVHGAPVARSRLRARRSDAPVAVHGSPWPVHGRRLGPCDGRVGVTRRACRASGERLRVDGDPVARIERP